MNTQNDWEKEIREMLDRIIINPGYETAWFNRERTQLINGVRIDGFIWELKSFIKSPLQKQRQELLDIVEGMRTNWKKEYPVDKFRFVEWCDGFNQALDQVLSIIKEK